MGCLSDETHVRSPDGNGRIDCRCQESLNSSKTVYRDNTANPGEEQTCGPARLDKLLTGWRGEHEWLGAGASVPQQQIIRDFARSRAKAQKDIQKRLPVRQRSGMPRFKKKDLVEPTLNYTRRGFRIRGGRLHLAGGIVLAVVWSRELPAGPSSVRVYRDGIGHWYASFVVPAEAEPLPVTGRVIGIDWGVRETATTTSEGHDLPHAGHGKKAAARLARYQRMMARRKPAKGRPGSKGYRKAKRQAAKQYKKVARQRQDTGRKKKTLIEMAGKHGRDLRLVNPAYSTMDCAQCGARTKHALPLSERTYTCAACGAVSPRDKNSAHVMLARAGLNPAGADRIGPDRPQDHQAA